MKIKRSKLKKYWIFFLLLPLSIRWEINDYHGNVFTQAMENIIRILAALCIFYIFIYKTSKTDYISEIRKPDNAPIPFLLLVLMQGWILLSTVIHDGNVRGCLMGLFPLVVVGLWYEIIKNDTEIIIKCGMLISEILIYANLLTIFLFPDGMYSTFEESGIWFSSKNWLLQNRNDFIAYNLFAAMVAFIYGSHGGKKWREWGIYIASLLSVILARAVTSTVAMLLLLVLFLILKTGRIRFNVMFLVGINIALFFMIVVFRLQDLFSHLIVDILGKDLTFTGRTTLWDVILPIIGDNLFFGLGRLKHGGFQELTGISFAGQAHNIILNCLYLGGIPCLMFYIMALFFIYKKLHKFQHAVEAQVVMVTLFVFQIAALMEAYEKMSMLIFIYLIYFIAYNIDRFIYSKKGIRKRPAKVSQLTSTDR